MIKYKNIERLKDKYQSAFTRGEHIVCQEKLDGSNASFCYDEKSNMLIAFSRKQQLTQDNGLNGFYDFVSTLNVKVFKDILKDNLVIFGEWLLPHAIKYPAKMYHNFYVFDIYDKSINSYLPWEQTVQIANQCGLNLVPVFYDGAFVSWEDIFKLVGQTKMEAFPCGEGQVIKSQDRLGNKSSNTPEYVKIVAEQFSEVHQHKPQKIISQEELAERESQRQLCETIVTKRRIEKFLDKLVDEGILPEDWDEHNFGTIAKTLPREIYNDCVKEEPETTNQIEDFGKICGKLTMELVRSLIK